MCSGTITLTLLGGGPITITNNTTIDGTGHNVTISGGGAVDVFVVFGTGMLTLNKLTIANGISGFGGGIGNLGTGTVTNSTFSGNNRSFGGGVFNDGTLTVTNSTFTGNSAGSGLGGGIYSLSSVTLTLRNAIVANSSAGGNCGGAVTDG
jgi:hypothetical protein